MVVTTKASERALAAHVRTLLFCEEVCSRLAGRARRDERGDVYSNTIMVALGVVIAITVGGILLYKFQSKAQSIDTDTPGVSVPAPAPAGP